MTFLYPCPWRVADRKRLLMAGNAQKAIISERHVQFVFEQTLLGLVTLPDAEATPLTKRPAQSLGL
jgi:hypothetical protein